MQEEKDVKGLNSRRVEGVGSRGIFRRKTPSPLPRLRKAGCEEPGSGCARRAVAGPGLGVTALQLQQKEPGRALRWPPSEGVGPGRGLLL